jgi:hypothetical protein
LILLAHVLDGPTLKQFSSAWWRWPASGGWGRGRRLRVDTTVVENNIL